MNLKSLLALSLSFLVFAPTASSSTLLTASAKQAESDTATNVYYSAISSLRLGTYKMTFSGTVSTEYPGDYAIYNSTSTVSYERDYGVLLREDGSKEHAVRSYTSASPIVYFEDEEGLIYREYYQADNTVTKEVMTYYTQEQLFNDYYPNPFDYISSEDIDTEGNLDPEKAGFIYNCFTGDSRAVKSAKLVLDNQNNPTGITYEFYTTLYGLVISSSYSVMTYYQYLNGSFSFDFDNVESFEHLSPIEETNEAVESAFAATDEATNYTIYTDSNGLSRPVLTYVVGDTIYVHTDAYTSYPVSGDIIYTKRSDGAYRIRTYDGSSWSYGSTVQLNEILPDYSSIYAGLFTETSTDNYMLMDTAATYVASSLLLGYTAVSDGTGNRATVTLKDGKVSKTVSTYTISATNVAITNSYLNYGTTSLPSYLDSIIG